MELDEEDASPGPFRGDEDVEVGDVNAAPAMPFHTPPTPYILEQLPPNVFHLVSPLTGANVFLVGTVHVSAASVESVRKTCALISPDTVFVELCSRRTGLLQGGSEKEPIAVTPRALYEAYRENGGVMGVAAVLLASFMAKASATLGVQLGAEMRAAYEEAVARRCRVVLGDRPVNVTMARAVATMTVWQKLRIAFELYYSDLSAITAEDVEKMKNNDVVAALMEELGKFCPALTDCIIHERDLYMAWGLRRIPARNIVAVVGLGHCSGIQAAWDEALPLEQMRALMVVPPGGDVNWRLWLGGALSILLVVVCVGLYLAWRLFTATLSSVW